MRDPLPVAMLGPSTGAAVGDDVRSPEPSPLPVSPPSVTEDLGALIRAVYRELSGQLSDANRELRGMHDAQRETALRLTKLETAVFGSEPPPPPAAKMPPLLHRTSTAEADVDALQGNVIALRAEVERVAKLNEAQNRAAGVAPEGARAREKAIAFLFSRAGANAAIRLVTVVTGLLVAAQTVPACGGRSPAAPPASTAPASSR